MERKEFLEILENIYGALTYEDWVSAKEYVKIIIDRIKSESEKGEKFCRQKK